MIIYYSDGSKFKGTYSSGKRNGPAIEVDKNGVRFEGSYRDDKRNGKYIEKDRDGKIISQGVYTDGRKN